MPGGLQPPRLRVAPAPPPARSLAPCDHPDCDAVQSAEFWPYCSQTCAVKSAWAAVAVVEQTVGELDAPLQELRRLDVILDSCPFEEAGEKLQQIIRDVRAVIGGSQRELAKSAVEFTHGATAFTDALGPLIVGCDDDLRQAHPAWMKHPETWAAARDPRWQRGAMGGDFVQHWLSYHLFELADGVILVVYRSTWLRETDGLYKRVADLLAGGYEVLFRDRSPDENMMFGQAELTIYALPGPE